MIIGPAVAIQIGQKDGIENVISRILDGKSVINDIVCHHVSRREGVRFILDQTD